MTDDPGWTLSVTETSAGTYRVDGRDLAGRSYSATGGDPEKLLQDAREWLAANADSVATRSDHAT